MRIARSFHLDSILHFVGGILHFVERILHFKGGILHFVNIIQVVTFYTQFKSDIMVSFAVANDTFPVGFSIVKSTSGG